VCGSVNVDLFLKNGVVAMRGWQVSVLEQEVETMSKEITSQAATGLLSAAPRAARSQTQSLHGMDKRMAWAREAMNQPRKLQMLAVKKKVGASYDVKATKKRGLAHEIDVVSPYYAASRDDPISTQGLASESKDSNWIDALVPGDYWKDP
jgi:hypothetical protein